MADGPYSLPDLPYDYAALEPYYSGEILELHHDKHHAGYVRGANTTLERLAEARERGDWETIVGLEKNLAFNVSGHVLHSIFWFGQMIIHTLANIVRANRMPVLIDTPWDDSK